jgi:hypothetical protein
MGATTWPPACTRPAGAAPPAAPRRAAPLPEHDHAGIGRALDRLAAMVLGAIDPATLPDGASHRAVAGEIARAVARIDLAGSGLAVLEPLFAGRRGAAGQLAVALGLYRRIRDGIRAPAAHRRGEAGEAEP